MSWKRRVQVLFLEEISLMKSESQHGSSWVNKFHKTMEKLVFGNPLCNEQDFDPLMESIYCAAAESSHEREVSAQDDAPMNNPYEQPSRRGRSQEREEPQGRGRSQEREEPQDVWEQQRSSSGSSEPPQHDDPQQDAQDNQQEEPSVDVQDDPMGEEVVNLWEAEDPPDDMEDPIVEQATRSSISASNPWVLYEAGIVCAREENGELIKNSSGEKVIVLREWNLLLTPQKIALRRQSINRADWEKLPWTGHQCLLFTRAWEIGRMLAHSKKKETLKPWKVIWALVDDIGQTGCEVKLNHQVGKTGSVSAEKTGERSSCYMKET